MEGGRELLEIVASGFRAAVAPCTPAARIAELEQRVRAPGLGSCGGQFDGIGTPQQGDNRRNSLLEGDHELVTRVGALITGPEQEVLKIVGDAGAQRVDVDPPAGERSVVQAQPRRVEPAEHVEQVVGGQAICVEHRYGAGVEGCLQVLDGGPHA